MAHQLAGVLIVVEGIDGAGKSTLIQQVNGLLQKQHTVITTKEPGGSMLGTHLRSLLQHQPFPIAPRAEYLLFAADRAQHFHDVVIPGLTNGALVLSDRMSDSSLAYQGYGRGHDLETIHMINRWTMHDITPDITIYLKIPLDRAYERMHQRKETLTTYEKEQRSFMERVAHGFDTLYKNRTDVLILDAQQDSEVLAQQAHNYIVAWINAHRKASNQ